jgi:hypothetical protein
VTHRPRVVIVHLARVHPPKEFIIIRLSYINFLMCAQAKDAKKRYRRDFEEFKQIKVLHPTTLSI